MHRPCRGANVRRIAVLRRFTHPLPLQNANRRPSILLTFAICKGSHRALGAASSGSASRLSRMRCPSSRYKGHAGTVLRLCRGPKPSESDGTVGNQIKAPSPGSRGVPTIPAATLRISIGARAAESGGYRLGRQAEKRQSNRPPSPSVSLDIFDPECGWADVPTQTTPAPQDIKRLFSAHYRP